MCAPMSVGKKGTRHYFALTVQSDITYKKKNKMYLFISLTSSFFHSDMVQYSLSARPKKLKIKKICTVLNLVYAQFTSKTVDFRVYFS